MKTDNFGQLLDTVVFLAVCKHFTYKLLSLFLTGEVD